MRAISSLLIAGLLSAVAPVAGAAGPDAGAMPGTGPELRPTTVLEPWYGEGLFYYFQERYFTSLTELMVSEHFGRVARQADEVELVRAGLLLSYGMHTEASAAFTRLIERGAPPAVRDRAWYFLARIRYQRGYADAAREALSHIGGILPPDIETDRRLLESRLLMEQGEFSRAAEVLHEIKGDSEAALYVRYNLGVALARSGQVLKGSELLEHVGRAVGDTEEIRSLRDKANVALAFAALRDKEAERAKLYLERVRLQGLMATRALLGYGWAELALEHPERSLVAWNELASREPVDGAILEAQLAIAYATSKMGANAEAVDAYDHALQRFEAESRNIDAAIASVRSGEVLRRLLAANARQETDLYAGIDDVSSLPGASYLVDEISGHEFQEAFKAYRDLHALADNLAHWESVLPEFDDMLASRARAYSERVSGPQGDRRDAELAALTSRRDALHGTYEAALQDGDPMVFADADEQRLARRLDSVEGVLARLGSDPRADSLRERALRVRGALLWRSAEQLSARRRQAENDLMGLDAEIGKARDRLAAIDRARQDEPGRIGAFGERSRELAARIGQLRARTAALISAQEALLGRIAVAALEQQKQWLAGYATEARFAVAQIYDRASTPAPAAPVPADPGTQAPAPTNANAPEQVPAEPTPSHDPQH